MVYGIMINGKNLSNGVGFYLAASATVNVATYESVPELGGVARYTYKITPAFGRAFKFYANCVSDNFFGWFYRAGTNQIVIFSTAILSVKYALFYRTPTAKPSGWGAAVFKADGSGDCVFDFSRNYLFMGPTIFPNSSYSSAWVNAGSSEYVSATLSQAHSLGVRPLAATTLFPVQYDTLDHGGTHWVTVREWQEYYITASAFYFRSHMKATHSYDIPQPGMGTFGVNLIRQ